MNRNKKARIFIFLGIILPTVFWLVVDWISVKSQTYLSEIVLLEDNFLWGVWIILSVPLIFIGVCKIFVRKMFSAALTALIVLVLAFANAILLIQFHFWIGGTK